MIMEEVLEISISMIKFDDKYKEEIMPLVYNYIIYWQYIYFNEDRELIGKSGMHHNRHI